MMTFFPLYFLLSKNKRKKFFLLSKVSLLGCVGPGLPEPCWGSLCGRASPCDSHRLRRCGGAPGVTVTVRGWCWSRCGLPSRGFWVACWSVVGLLGWARVLVGLFGWLCSCHRPPQWLICSSSPASCQCHCEPGGLTLGSLGGSRTRSVVWLGFAGGVVVGVWVGPGSKSADGLNRDGT